MDTLVLYASTYFIVDVFCIVMAVVINRRVGDSFGSEMEIRHFKRMLGYYLLFCLTDALWMPINCGALTPNTAANALLSTLNMFSTAFIAYHWYCYAQVKMLSRNIEGQRARALALLPILILVVLYATNPVTSFIFSFSENGSFVQGPWYGIAMLAGSTYLLIVAVQAVSVMSKPVPKAVRDECLTFVTFALIPALASLVDALFPNTPVIALGVLTAILFVFSSLQDARIFNDALTGLNNRRRADEYLLDKISEASAQNAVYVYVLDVNLFKRINDGYGHVEGDRALRIVAEGLRLAAGANGGFAARWGGDEFVMVVDAQMVSSPDEVVVSIESNLDQVKRRVGVPYELSVSTGYTVCTSPSDQPGELFSRADEMLYERKREAHERAA